MLRKQNQFTLARRVVTPTQVKATPKSRVLLLTSLALFCFVVFIIRRKKVEQHNDTPTPLAKHENNPDSSIVPVVLDNCELIKKLLSGEIPSSNDGLPSAGKPTDFGAVFWLKTPVLRAQIPDDVVLLKYNHYLPKQHILKWSNTVSILSTFRDATIFPKMYAYCKDAGDTFSYILVEWIDLHPVDLPKPTNFEQCFDRSDRVVNLLERIDEDMHLAFMDVKKGQWMSRNDGKSFVLQDIDDVVKAPWNPTNEAGDLYFDQVEGAQEIIRSHLPKGTSMGYVKQIWEKKLFPNGYTIRYAMILLGNMIYSDVGFNWRQDCNNGMPSNFLTCFDQVLSWASTIEDNWPAPKQVRWALNECKRKSAFDKNDPDASRLPAPWRDSTPKELQKTYISCYQQRDPIHRTDKLYTENLSWCQHDDSGMPYPSQNRTGSSCCRSKGSNPCYYTAKDQKLCEKHLPEGL